VLRLALIGAISLMLAWLVLTKSLPFALAPSSPDQALALNPSNPAALIAKAQQIRDELLTRGSPVPEQSGPEGAAAASQHSDVIARAPEANGRGPGEPPKEREALKNELRDLAARAIAKDPLNAEAYRLLAEMTADPDRVRQLMQEAVSRSRRESVALFWLLNDSFYRKDYQASLGHADILLRTRPALAEYVLAYVVFIAEDPQGLPLAVEALAKNPAWRTQFFGFLPRGMRGGDTPFRLAAALKEAGSPVSAPELAPLLDALIRNNRTDAAYNLWLQCLSEADLAALGLLTNAGFEKPPSGLPFDWRIARGLNASAELLPSGGAPGVLHVRFGTGRAKFPELTQVVFLAPGRYRLEGKFRGRILATRGLRWQIHCAAGPRRPLGETEMLMGDARQGRSFALDAEVPAGGECVGQVVRLFHDARSASEELISGEVWFEALRLERSRDETLASH
jgi:hypothetical protein